MKKRLSTASQKALPVRQSDMEPEGTARRHCVDDRANGAFHGFFMQQMESKAMASTLSKSPVRLFNPVGLYDASVNGYSHIGLVPSGVQLAFIAGQGGEDEHGHSIRISGCRSARRLPIWASRLPPRAPAQVTSSS
ncbi:hypothetical protein [Sinorhizobium sp. A49]|uniref:hypothetical protein n=1 Tax=Sinorhizobium sp. A49 TaxID=1945861 RepID=UPI001AECEDF7|nr:hypothetical protein [Sinorhizobium sp. A49]